MIARVDQRGCRMTHVVRAVQQAMSVPGHARPRTVCHGNGRGKLMPVLRRGLRRRQGSPPTPELWAGSVGNHPWVAPPPGPVAPHEE